MKNLFGYDLQTEAYDGENFIIRKTDGKGAGRQDGPSVKTETAKKRKKFPLWLTALRYVCVFAVILIAFTVAMDLQEVRFSRTPEDFVWKVAAVSVAAAGWVALFMAERIFNRAALKACAVDGINAAEEEAFAKNCARLGVPDGADVLDVLSQSGDGENDRRAKKRTMYFSVKTRVFEEDGNLCFCDSEAVMAVPFEEIIKVVRRDEKFAVGNWTKAEAHNAGRFKNFRVRKTPSGKYLVKPCYSVRINRAGEEFEIIVPCYDAEILKKHIDFAL